MIDSVRGRLTAWYVIVLAVTLMSFELAVYAVLSRTLHERVDQTLASAVDVTATSLANDIAEGQTPDEAARATVDEISSRQVAVAVFTADARLMASREWDDDFRPSLPLDAAVPEEEPRLYDVHGEDRMRVAIRRVRARPELPPFIVHVSTSLEDLEDELEDVRTVLLSAIPVVLLTAGGAGWFMARKSFRPVVLMAERAREISARNLDQRLPISNPRDELGQLASTFNELLGRLAAAFSQQRQFMADASHELRTPLATIRAATSVTLQQTHRSEVDYRDALQMIDEQTVRLTRIVDDMFTLARADAGHLPLHYTAFYLDELLAEVLAAARVRRTGGGDIVQEGATDVECMADEELVRRLVTNLVDNAIKYSPVGSEVRVRFTEDRGRARIAVTDRGPGIGREAQTHVFERFYRGDQSRTRAGVGDGSGAGLGLAIARWIAEAHGGRLELVRSDASGTEFAVELPLSPRPHSSRVYGRVATLAPETKSNGTARDEEA